MENYNNDIDNHIDDLLFKYINLQAPKSFFLFAGAGSGKTRSLVTLLNKIRDAYSKDFIVSNKKVAIITYTNAAADEIKRRIGSISIFSISTIHSFIWDLIQHFQAEIKSYMLVEKQSKIDEIKSKKTAHTVSNQNKISNYEAKIENLKSIKRFVYNPNGDNTESNSLSHQDVIKLGVKLISSKKLFQEIVVQRYPILLIDESQDTNKALIESMFELQQSHQSKFVLGLFGDVKQRIYFDGKHDLGLNLPEGWEKPVKRMNHRSSRRIIQLANHIAHNTIDMNPQLPRTDADDGFAKLFIVNTSCDKKSIESRILDKMRVYTQDEKWVCPIDENGNSSVKKLILEHHMAANRLGFISLFQPIYQNEDTKNGVLDGSLPELKLFIDFVVPIYRASKQEDGGKFAIASLIRKKSPLLDKSTLKNSESKVELLNKANRAVTELCSLWNGSFPTLYDIVKCINKHSLFRLPESLTLLCNSSDEETSSVWDTVKYVTLDQIIAYSDYISDSSEFGTHQGVKGLEYDRVMVIIDDDEAIGNMFSYDKLFGVASKSERDIKNEQEGKETTIDRTTRLFYVTCTRAKKSLAIVAYTNDPHSLKTNVIKMNLFNENEIEELL